MIPTAPRPARTVAERNQLVSDHLWVARDVAWRQCRRHPMFDVEDLMGDAYEGLIDAAERWDENNDASFPTYARTRAYGAMIDGLRRMDQVPRSRRRRERDVRSAVRRLQAKLGQEPSDQQVADHIGIAPDEVADNRQYASVDACDTQTLERTVGAVDERVDVGVEEVDMVATAFELVDRLPPKHRTVMLRCVAGGETLAEVGRTLGVTESRVSQLRTEAVEALRSRMQDMGAPESTAKYGSLGITGKLDRELDRREMPTLPERLNDPLRAMKLAA